MDTIREILVLGGYGAYVWPAFGTWALVMACMAFSTLRRLRQSERTLDDLQAAQGGRRARPSADERQQAS